MTVHRSLSPIQGTVGGFCPIPRVGHKAYSAASDAGDAAITGHRSLAGERHQCPIMISNIIISFTVRLKELF